MLIYHSPSDSDAAFIEYLEESCDRALMSDNFIVMGDFNIDIKVQGHTQDKLRKTMNSAGLSQLVQEATRITSTSQIIIDLVFSDMDLQVEVWHEPKITDHSMIVLNRNINEIKGRNQRIVCRDYKRMDIDTFKSLIELNININEEESINEIANRMVNTIVECIDIVAPEKPIIIKKKLQGKQWFSEDIYKQMNRRDLAHRAARLSNSIKDWILFKQLRNKVVDASRKAKRKYGEKIA